MPATPAAPFDPMRFAEAHRIHIQNGSIDGPSELLHFHVAELDPANEAVLRAKIKTVFRQKTICFGDSPFATLGGILAKAQPLSAEAEQSVVLEQIGDLLKKQSGIDPEIAKNEKAEKAPLATAIARDRERKPFTPAQKELLRNGIGLTLLFEKALEGTFPQGFETFLRGSINPEMSVDQLFGVFGQYGIDGAALQAAAQKGPRAFGEALKLDPLFIDEVGRLTNYLAQHGFSDSDLQNWRVGRALPGMAHAGVAEQMMAGREPRITQMITSLRAACHGHYTVSPEIAAMERDVAGQMRLLPPVLAEALFLNGTYIAVSPNHRLPSPVGTLLGYHGHLTVNGDDIGGVRCITVSQGQGADESARILVHEAHHLTFANQLSPADIAKVESLAASDATRLATLRSALKIWSSGTDEQKATAIRQIETQFTGGKPLAEVLGGKSIETLAIMAGEAADRLDAKSNYYRIGVGYGDVATRFNEIISRYSELRYVRLREEPALLNFLVPGLKEAYDTVYLPHLERQVAEMRQRAPKSAPAANTNTPPQTQVETQGVVHAPAAIIAASPPVSVSL